MRLTDFARRLDEILDVGSFRDYSPNGLQVEGRPEVRSIVTGVTASIALIDAAIEANADAILVHHGYFWRGEDPRIVGTKRARIAKLLGANVSLFGFHLPLDAHAELGNNAQLGKRLGASVEGRAGEQNLVVHGSLDAPCALDTFSARIEAALGRKPLVIGESNRLITRVAWCTGGAQGYFETALTLGIDAYVTGEVSEQHFHLARESGVAFIAAGHHATERFGIQALGEYVADAFGLTHRFIDVPNPV